MILLDDLLKQKGLENNVTNSFDKLVGKEPLLCQNSDKPLQTKKENSTIKDKINTRDEINKFGSMKRQEPLQNSANPPAITS